MTGLPDDGRGAARDGDLSGRFDDGRPDPLEPLLRRPVPHLPAPAGAYERIRRSAARRRRTRAALSGGAAAAVIAGALYVGGSLTSGGRHDMVGPPADSSGPTSAPPPATTPAVTSSQAPQPTTGTGGTHTGQESGGATGSAGPSGPSTATPTPSGTTPMCTAAQLSASLGGADAAAGNLYRYLVLTNRGSTACHLTGYPGVSLLDAHNRQIGQPATREPSSYQPVVLRPGGSASDTVHTANRQGTCLAESAQVRIYPPGSLDALLAPGRITVCDNVFTVTPLAAGTTGNPPQ